MNWMKKVEEKRNSRLICLMDLSSGRNSSLSSLDGEADAKMKTVYPTLQPYQPAAASAAPASGLAAAAVRRLSSTDVAVKGPDGDRFRRSVDGNDLYFNGLSPSQTAPDTTSRLSSITPSDSSPAQHNDKQQQQLGKLKRFLATLERLGADISPVIGHEVNSLVRALIEKTITVEDFHDQLHRSTNFPLRPFVIPFLKSSLPILQEEVQSRLKGLPLLSPYPNRDHQKQNQLSITNITNATSVLCGVGRQIGAAQAKSSASSGDNDRSQKRPARDFNYNKAPQNGGYEMNGCAFSPKSKRLRTCSPTSQSNANSLDDSCKAHSADGASGGQIDSLLYKASKGGPSGIRPLGNTNTVQLITQPLEGDDEPKSRNRFYSGSFRSVSVVNPFDEDWNYVETILQCIVGLTERCQRALHVLQERTEQRSKNSHASKNTWNIPLTCSSSPSSCSSSFSSFCNRSLTNGAIAKKQLPAESSRAEISQKEEHRLDLIRCAEDAVNDVKRQAMLELQKAVAAAESKASEAMYSSDRLDVDRTLDEVRDRARTEVAELLNRQVDCNESCWNCGRVASETCSGCNRARYCGIFCQHRHWEMHHRVCRNASPYLCMSPSTRPDPRGYLYYEGGASSPNSTQSGATITEDYCIGGRMAATSTVQPPSEVRERLQVTTALCQSETQLIVSVKQETI